MSLPRLRTALVLEAQERVSDGAGGFVDGWVALGTVWAEITAQAGRETAHQGAPVSRTGYRIVLRGAPFGSPDRPKPEQRFRDGARIFAIRAVAERDGAGRYLTCHCDEEAVV